jgi:hypothetical protein
MLAGLLGAWLGGDLGGRVGGLSMDYSLIGKAAQNWWATGRLKSLVNEIPEPV